jgi:hypothetical protein
MWGSLFHRACRQGPVSQIRHGLEPLPASQAWYTSGRMSDSPVDAIVVPGGGLLLGGEIPPWVEVRLARAMETSRVDVPIVLLSAGTVYKSHPIAANGRPIYESRAAAEWLARRGVSPRRLFVETVSLDTVGNAYFLRTIHTDPRRWRRLRVITSEFHLERVRATFLWIFAARPVGGAYRLEFESVPDVGMNSRVLAARTAKEAASLASIRPLISRTSTLREIHQWLFTEHRAYSVDSQGEPPELPDDLIETY